MDFEAREKRKYIRNALLSFVCTAVCIGIDIRSFWRHGGFYMTWQLAVSFASRRMLAPQPRPGRQLRAPASRVFTGAPKCRCSARP